MSRRKFEVGDEVKWFGNGGAKRKLYASRATLRGRVTRASRFDLTIMTTRGEVLVTTDECELVRRG